MYKQNRNALQDQNQKKLLTNYHKAWEYYDKIGCYYKVSGKYQTATLTCVKKHYKNRILYLDKKHIQNTLNLIPSIKGSIIHPNCIVSLFILPNRIHNSGTFYLMKKETIPLEKILECNRMESKKHPISMSYGYYKPPYYSDNSPDYTNITHVKVKVAELIYKVPPFSYTSYYIPFSQGNGVNIIKASFSGYGDYVLLLEPIPTGIYAKIYKNIKLTTITSNNMAMSQHMQSLTTSDVMNYFPKVQSYLQSKDTDPKFLQYYSASKVFQIYSRLIYYSLSYNLSVRSSPNRNIPFTTTRTKFRDQVYDAGNYRDDMRYYDKHKLDHQVRPKLECLGDETYKYLRAHKIIGSVWYKQAPQNIQQMQKIQNLLIEHCIIPSIKIYHTNNNPLIKNSKVIIQAQKQYDTAYEKMLKSFKAKQRKHMLQVFHYQWETSTKGKQLLKCKLNIPCIKKIYTDRIAFLKSESKVYNLNDFFRMNINLNCFINSFMVNNSSILQYSSSKNTSSSYFAFNNNYAFPKTCVANPSKPSGYIGTYKTVMVINSKLKNRDSYKNMPVFIKITHYSIYVDAPTTNYISNDIGWMKFIINDGQLFLVTDSRSYNVVFNLNTYLKKKNIQPKDFKKHYPKLFSHRATFVYKIIINSFDYEYDRNFSG